MGRAKLNMELITKEKSRNITYKKRKDGLIKKIREFTTLCGVSACMIIYGPKQERVSSEPEIWPSDPNEIRRIIDLYKSKNKDSGHKSYGLLEFFHDRKRKIEEELARQKKKNLDSKYPTKLEDMNIRLTKPQLSLLVEELSKKSEYVRSRIEMLRRTAGQGAVNNNMDFNNAPFNISDPRLIIQQGVEWLNHQELMMMSMNGQFGPYNQCATSYNGQSPMGPARYYVPPGPVQLATHQPQYMMNMPPYPPHFQYLMEAEGNNNGDLVQYQSMNNRDMFM